MMLDKSFLPKYETYNNDNLELEYEKYCNDKSDPDYMFWRIFFEAEVVFLKQGTSNAIYKLKDAECIISVRNAGHVRMTNFPYPDYFPIIAMVYDRRLWGKKRCLEIIEGEIPKRFITLDTVHRYKQERSIW